MQAQLFDGTSPTMEANLKYTKDAPLPSNAHNLKPNQMLVRVTATSLNPVDYKFASLPIVGRLIVPRPSSPGLDFAGWVASSQPPSPFKYGQQVFGRLNRPQQYGALGEYVVASTTEIVPRPEGLSKEDAASIGTAGLTAYQSIVPYVKPGDRVFINGGSGGVGSFCIQIAKALGCHVTTSCSTGNVQLCKDLGADRVIDYKSEAVVKVFQTSGKYQHVVDNVGTNPELWNGSEVGTDASTQYVQVGAEINLWAVVDSLKSECTDVCKGKKTDIL